jgi:hypothetical protein
LRQAASANATVAFRIYDIFATIIERNATTPSRSPSSVASPPPTALFQRCIQTGFIGDLVARLDSSDTLQQLVVVDMLNKISRSADGARYLEQTRVFRSLIALSRAADNSIEQSLIAPNIIALFGELASFGGTHLELLDGLGVFQHWITILKEDVGTLDMKVRKRRICCVSVCLCVSVYVCVYLLFLSQKAVIIDVGKLLSTSAGFERGKALGLHDLMLNELRLDRTRMEVLESLTYLLTHFRDDVGSAQSSAFIPLQQWLQPDSLRGSTTPQTDSNFDLHHTLWQFVSRPFLPLRLATFRCFASFVRISWGAQTVLAHGQFFDFLIDRSTETTTDGKRARRRIRK